MTINFKAQIAVLGVVAVSAVGLTSSVQADQTCKVVRFGTSEGINTGIENYSKITLRCSSGASLWFKVMTWAGKDTTAVTASQAEASRLTDALFKAWETGAELLFAENNGQITHWELQPKP